MLQPAPLSFFLGRRDRCGFADGAWDGLRACSAFSSSSSRPNTQNAATPGLVHVQISDKAESQGVRAPAGLLGLFSMDAPCTCVSATMCILQAQIPSSKCLWRWGPKLDVGAIDERSP